jgi:hypothetical protein
VMVRPRPAAAQPTVELDRARPQVDRSAGLGLSALLIKATA